MALPGVKATQFITTPDHKRIIIFHKFSGKYKIL